MSFLSGIGLTDDGLPPAWFDHPGVKCKGAGKLLYAQTNDGVQKAKAICNGTDGTLPCVWRDVCRRHAINRQERNGVWGGLSERDRKKIWRARKRLAKAGLPYEHVYTLEQARFPGIAWIERRVNGTGQGTRVHLQRSDEDHERGSSAPDQAVRPQR